jgi:hypothetical protein
MVIKRGLVIGAAAEQALIVDEISGPDTNLADHEDILWYPRFSSKANIQSDWSILAPTYPDFGTTGLEIIEWTQFGIPAARVKSQKLGDTIEGDVGTSIMNWRKGVNSGRGTHTNNTIGSTEEPELYFRFCQMFEDMTGWGPLADPNPGGKLSSLEAYGVTFNVSYDRPNDPSEPLGVAGYIFSGPPINYFQHDPFSNGQGLVTRPLMIPGVTGSPPVANGSPAVGVYYSIEIHLKLNTRNDTESPSTFNSDGRMRCWLTSSDGEYDDVLLFDLQNLQLHDDLGPLGIDYIHGQLFSGGNNGPPVDYLYQQI